MTTVKSTGFLSQGCGFILVSRFSKLSKGTNSSSSSRYASAALPRDILCAPFTSRLSSPSGLMLFSPAFLHVPKPRIRLTMRPIAVSASTFGRHGTHTTKKPHVISAVAHRITGLIVYILSSDLPNSIVSTNLITELTTALGFKHSQFLMKM